jgi:hypothetical protein
VVSSALYHMAVFDSLAVDARRSVELIFVAPLGTVVGIVVGGVEVVRVMVKRVDGLFVPKRVFLLLML